VDEDKKQSTSLKSTSIPFFCPNGLQQDESTFVAYSF